MQRLSDRWVLDIRTKVKVSLAAWRRRHSRRIHAIPNSAIGKPSRDDAVLGLGLCETPIPEASEALVSAIERVTQCQLEPQLGS